jgi:hypothetical protein
MRIAVLIIGLVLSVGLFIQSVLVAGLSDAANDEASQSAGAVGVLMALLWVVACGLVIPVPIASVVLFVLAGLAGFAASGEFTDLAYWGGVSLVLAAFSFLGHRGKRKQQRKEDERDELMRRMAGNIQAANMRPAPAPSGPDVRCPQCGNRVDTNQRFCGTCGFDSATLAGNRT